MKNKLLLIMCSQGERSFITYPTWKKYIILSCHIESLRVRDKRQIFHTMRQMSTVLNEDSFLPQYGITAGEFAVWQVLSETRKTRRRAHKTGLPDDAG